MRLPPLPTVSEIVHLYQLTARKQLAQNFLLDMNLTRKVVRKAGSLKGGFVCEVGPGPGGITRSILNTDAKQVVVVEKDRRFIPGLQMLADACEDRMKIVHGDILQTKMEQIIPETYKVPWEDNPPNVHIIGNLPFNISTPLIVQWLEDIASQSGAWSYGRTKLTLTFQKEVAQRMVAPISSDMRCRLSVMCQYLCDVSIKFEIPGKAFTPAPKVDVGVVHFVPLVKPRINLPFKMVEKVCRHVFHYRQKMIKHSVATLFPVDMPELTAEMFERSDLDPSSRPPELKMQDINKLCNAYNEICHQHPFIFDFDYRSKKHAKLWRRGRNTLTEKLEERISVDLPDSSNYTEEIPAR
ncbi:dimethyladenosine transferase 1, mitochondrial-like [Haliotis rubra]|uniref:dimethyladenosine transferase 1, mitochondrial-like n=1 Tax=Haliotis rubra TaxID=36100 RepID=UPI001EE62485|nr:dimethyladenosine transferase 1, mitochondrial-like [Haliotis rubra]XP_046544834.1 dimethyladenosine transferase 1, mitochondrial-like [Haliotis rubra]XP_046544835.1 dimethyladenosine transferase 1, mitochondrial-like [Haliotis rubra]XP_046544836.1 dimethyladenosine transferase 1, mitochondrial-like [Haliotis rubra]XP_046544837.1 dimethyladenosine transferase 1, mitochondrial-like [Haliotis rubra]